MRLERELTAADEHVYFAELEEGGAVVGEADQDGVDLVVDVIAPDGHLLTRADSPNGTHGPEPFDVTALQMGTYKFVIHIVQKDAKPGRYHRDARCRTGEPPRRLLERFAIYS